MSEVKKVPEIRFAGFTDAWEQRKLGKVATFINGRAYSQPELLSSGKYKVLRVGNFYTNDLWYYSDLELGEKYYANYGDLLYTWSATFGPHIWLGDRVIYHYHIWKIDLSNQLEKQFAVQLLEQDKDNILSGKNGSTMVHITKEGMEQKDVIIPQSIKEQRRIGFFFNQLDNLITLHQRKHEKLVALKKAMLEKMFPKNGSNVPEVRFAGFTGPWEQRELGELCNITTGKLDANAMVSDGQYDFYTSGIDVFKIDVAAFEGPAITIAGNGASVGYMHLADGKFNAYQRTYVLTDFLADRQFLNVAIGNELPNKIQEEVRGSGIPYIVLNMLTDLAIPFPSHEEQYAIGVYFQQLDNLITLQQRKCESLKHVKAALLQKMFV